MKKLSKKSLIVIIALVVLLLGAWWIGNKLSGAPASGDTVAFETGIPENTQNTKPVETETSLTEAETTEAENPTSDNAGESDDDESEPEAVTTEDDTEAEVTTEDVTTAETTAPQTEDPDAITVEYGGEYNDKEHVALYIHLYGELPPNYITKKEAEALGWVSSKKNLAKVAPGKSIGGSRFGNNEGLLPKKKGRQYYECDIDYVSGARNAKRIVFSDDGLVFYTEDHYETFELLYE